jgi:uncharacterized protein (DUF362 family)
MENKFSETTVLVKRCEEYDGDKIEAIVTEGMEELKYRPWGKIFAKPNVVFAYDPEIYGKDAYTHPGLVAPVLLALARSPEVERVDLGENSAVAMPTRMAYKYSGYDKMVKEVRGRASKPVEMFCIDEERRRPVFVGGLVHESVRVSNRMARADGMVYLPKLKCHCVSTITGAVKLNIGVFSDDERSIRHDFLLDDKIVDALSVGYPDFIVMDAVTVGVGNEAMPIPRKLGLILMSRNPVAVDLVGARLLGANLEDVSHLQNAIKRGYSPKSLEDVTLLGDASSIDDLDRYAERLKPYDDEFRRWQDINQELERLKSPMRFFWGPYSGSGDKCLTGCVMGLKMFLCLFEHYAGPEAFAESRPVVMVIGRYNGPIDAKGERVFLIGNCAEAEVSNAKKITRIGNCFVTASDMLQAMSTRLGMPSPYLDLGFLLPYAGHILAASLKKTINLRYFQDVGHFFTKQLQRRV